MPGQDFDRAFFLWNTVFPRHLFFSDKWMVKGTKYQHAEAVELEKVYLRRNSYEEKITQVFNIAAIQYGRVDFARTIEGLAFFEINTNPTILDAWDLQSNRGYATKSFVPAFTYALRQLYYYQSNKIISEKLTQGFLNMG